MDCELCPVNYIKIGKLAATYGFKGDLVLVHEFGKKTALKDLKTIFLEDKKGSLLPWFIQSARAKSEREVFLKLEGIESKEEAAAVLQKMVWLPEEDFQRYASKTAPAAMIGFEIIQDGKNLGPVLELIEQPHQLLCRIELDGKEVLIPLNESSLKKVDQKKRQIIVELPDGLLDIYTKP